MSTPSWTIEGYCAAQAPPVDLAQLPPSTSTFFQHLNLSQVHPFCGDGAPQTPYELDGVPVMGPLQSRFAADTHPTILSVIVTLSKIAAPSLLAMSELWLRLFAGALAPLCISYLLLRSFFDQRSLGAKSVGGEVRARQMLSITSIISVASALVVMTDTLYVLELGAAYGCMLFLAAVSISVWTCARRNLRVASAVITGLVVLSASLVWDNETKSLTFGDIADRVDIEEGLYFDASNSLVGQIVQEWPKLNRTYSAATGKTPWIQTGDSKTGMPFLLNKVKAVDFTRTFLPTGDGEVVAMDVSAPASGHDTSKPLFMVLHGLNGGSSEEYIQDFTHRANADGSTVVVYVARGLMDTPIRGWDLFHGARTTDVHAAATALRRAIDSYEDNNQLLVGVGYSMGAIILSNYVSRYGPKVELDAAMPISGGLDMRYQADFYRAQRLWQPMLTETLRDQFLLGKWGQRVTSRLTSEEMLRLLRATHVTEVDEHAVVPYHGFDNLNHYYSEMSALGDIPTENYKSTDANGAGAIQGVSIPFCVVHALDDPLITWRAVAANEGFLHPSNLVQSGDGNTMILLTKSGGHVGWPTGMIPFLDKWRWMSELPLSYAAAVDKARRKANQN